MLFFPLLAAILPALVLAAPYPAASDSTSTSVSTSATGVSATGNATTTTSATGAADAAVAASATGAADGAASTPFVLPTPAEGPGPTFDDTATRAATGKTISNGGMCFDINDKSSGDDRLNGIEISMKPCTGDDGQKFDLITKGKNNDQAGFTLIASSQTFECIDRRAADNHANPGLFACGGRADGSSTGTSGDQLYAFAADSDITQPIGFPLQNGNGATCLTNNGKQVTAAACTPPNFSPEQLFTVG